MTQKEIRSADESNIRSTRYGFYRTGETVQPKLCARCKVDVTNESVQYRENGQLLCRGCYTQFR